MRKASPPLRRQYLIVALTFGALLLGVMALFAHLLIQQLSKRYLEDVLLSGQAYAEELAKTLHGDGTMYHVVERRREAITRITAALSQQKIWDSLKIYDNRGRLVLQTTTATEGYTGAFPESDSEFVLPPAGEPNIVETEKSYEIPQAVGDIGAIVLQASKPAVEARVAVLRRRLLINTAFAAGAALAVLAAAVLFIWHLVQRNARLEERRRAHEELAALGTFAANLAHEIRNPLNALSLNLELLAEDLDAPGSGPETVGMARREVERLSRLVSDFLVYARPAPPSKVPFVASELLDEIRTLLLPLCERSGVVVRVHAEDGVEVPGDRAQLSQVVMNLALNAAQAMESSPRRVMELKAYRNDGSVVLEVADTGPGIPDEDLEVAREVFWSRRKGGTGLGLAIATRAVEAHGGRLELVNRAEGGLAARVVLPAV